ncbi:MAG TPA: hypothetical protein VJ754_06080, partial [Anaerolineae bacterium]|nr:hypothetical protein [Anaerolineae bacterium]
MDDQTPAAPDPISEPSANPAVPSLPPRMARRLDPVPSRNRNLILYGVIAVLVIAGVILPPISLFERLFPGCGDLVIDAGNASAELAGGITVDRAGAEQSYRLTLKSVPQAEFQSGAAGETLAGARDSLPINLVVAGQVYQINVCGEKAQPGAIRAAVPATAASQSTLDLYGWYAKSGAWAWIGSNLNPSDATLSASVDALPDAIAVMQTTSVAPAIGVEMNTGESLQADVAGAATEHYPAGLVIGADGSIGGDRSALPGANSAQVTYPVIRNYVAGGQPNTDLVRGVLSVAETRQAHLDALAALARDGEYAGVTLDYQGLTSDDRDAYTAFVGDIASALHGQGKRLYVALPRPSILASGDTDTAGYDWHRLGLLADGVLAPM